MSEEEVRKALKRFISRSTKDMRSFAATVKSVNESERTCVLSPADGGPDYLDVRLSPIEGLNQGFLPIPAVGSHVLAGRLSNPNDTFILVYGEVTTYKLTCSDGGKIELNGNKYSLLKTEDLIKELKKTNSAVQSILNAINGGVAGTGTPDSGAALIASMKTFITGASVGDFSNMTNEKVLHG